MLIEIFSDVVCPWCAIGRARLHAALGAFEHRDSVELVYRAFELDPNAPMRRAGTNDEHIAAKYRMGIDEARRANEHLVEVAALDGLVFDFDRLASGNTFNAHRLIRFAQDRGRGDELVGALMHGYFSEGLAIGEPDALIAATAAIGFEESEVAGVLESQAFAAEVRDDEARARELDITGVPFMLIEGRFAIPGAQPVDRFALGLQRAWEKSNA